MAWTRSTPQRGSFADLLTQWASQFARSIVIERFATGQAEAVRMATLLRNADPLRGAFFLAAAVLALSAAAIPFIEVEIIAVILASTAAILCLVAIQPFQPTIQRTSDTAPQYARKVQAPTQATFKELLAASSIETCSTKRQIDRRHWAQLTAHMSHELRTPLNAVLGFSELMREETFGPIGASCYTGYADAIHSSGRSLLKSAEDALAITSLLCGERPVTGQRSATTLTTAIANATAFLSESFKARDLALASADHTDMAVIGDCQVIRQILINILSDVTDNAISGQTVNIETRTTHSNLHVTFSAAQCATAEPIMGDERFALMMVRTLAELSGIAVTSQDHADGTRAITLRFQLASQQDLFDHAA